jgi:hypothetical protein
VVLDVTPPRPGEIAIDLQAQGLRASVLQKVAGVEGEVRRFVAKYVAREVDKPYVRQARTIDVADAIEKAWSRMGLGPDGGGRSDTVEHIASDLHEAIRDEIDETADAPSPPEQP